MVISDPDGIQGSIIASLDAASGTLTKAGFQPYGESGTTAGTFRYTGARIDAETNGLYDFRARIYSPLLGRFMQTDPSEAQGGRNLYAYVNNDPLNLVDLFGLAPDSPQAESSGGGFGNNSLPPVAAAAAGGEDDGERNLLAGIGALGAIGIAGANVVGFPEVEAGEGLGTLAFLGAEVLGVTGEAAEGSEEFLAGARLNVNPLGGTMNCVNCAVATEATLAGNPASALLSGPQPISALGSGWQSVSGEMQIGNILSQSGSGAQGIIYGESVNGGVGHVWNAINNGGVINFVDGQVGGSGLANFSNFQNFQFLLRIPGN